MALRAWVLGLANASPLLPIMGLPFQDAALQGPCRVGLELCLALFPALLDFLVFPTVHEGAGQGIRLVPNLPAQLWGPREPHGLALLVFCWDGVESLQGCHPVSGP